MALDPQIPLRATAPQIDSGAQVLENAFKTDDILRQRREEAEARQKAKEQERDLQDAFQRHRRADGSPDYDTIVNSLSGKYPDVAMTLRERVTKIRHDTASRYKAEAEAENAMLEQTARLLQGVATPQDYAAVYPRLDPETAELLGQDYDPIKVQQAVAAGMTLAEFNRQTASALDLALSGDVEAAVARVLPLAVNQETWDEGLALGSIWGLPEETIKMLGREFSPEAVERAKQLGLTVEERYDQANTEADNARLQQQVAANIEHQRGTRQINRDREDRLTAADQRRASGGDTSATTGATTGGGDAPIEVDNVTARRAREWYVEQVEQLDNALQQGRGDPNRPEWATDTPGTPGATGMSEEEYEARRAQIEQRYEFMLTGRPPKPPKYRSPADERPREPVPPTPSTPGEAGTRQDIRLPGRGAPATRSSVSGRGGGPGPRASASSVRPGRLVELQDGRRIRVKKVGPNGAITDYEVVE